MIEITVDDEWIYKKYKKLTENGASHSSVITILKNLFDIIKIEDIINEKNEEEIKLFKSLPLFYKHGAIDIYYLMVNKKSIVSQYFTIIRTGPRGIHRGHSTYFSKRSDYISISKEEFMDAIKDKFESFESDIQKNKLES